MVIVAVDS